MNTICQALTKVFALALVAAGLTVGVAGSASAADYCGSGWHKQSDGSLGSSKSLSSHGRTYTASLGGYVRFCTRERTLKPDQKNQRVLIGIPSTINSVGKVSGPHARICVTQTITAHISPWVSSASIGVSGTTPGASVTITGSQVKSSYTSCAGSGTWRVVIPQRSMVVTAPNGICEYYGGAWAAACYAGPYITKVNVSTTTRIRYYVNGTQFNPPVSVSEDDYS